MKLPKEAVGTQAGMKTKRLQDWSQNERFRLVLESQGKEHNIYSKNLFW
jgi:hypothetical protein